MPITPDKIRNIAIIAHIDHGKTTLIDSIFKSAQTFDAHSRVEERVMDNNELEKERGITIRSKPCTVNWKDYRINIIDTPGHADFSGEVERVLSTVDSVLLLVDANEGPMPQTRYVLMRSLRLGLRPIVIINKIDRPNAQPDVVLDKTFDLFLELGANDEQADFPVLYGSGLNGWMRKSLDGIDLQNDKPEGMEDLFEMVVDYVPAPEVVLDAPFLMQISSLAWSDYVGRIAGGRVLQGSHKRGQVFQRITTQLNSPGSEEWHITGRKEERSQKLWTTEGLDRVETDEVFAGDIVWINGPEEIGIGDTFSAPSLGEDAALPPLEIEEPTVSMFFIVNNGPFAAKEGDAVTLRQLRARLDKELKNNVALRVEDIGRADGLKVSGRGELHLAILIEEMRRENMELLVSRPVVITHEENGKLMEPKEQALVDVPEIYQGTVIEALSRRKGELRNMEANGTGMIRLEFDIPTRGLIGYRNEFLTETRGLGIMASRFVGFMPWAGEISARKRGALVSMETGEATAWCLESLQVRTTLFVSPMEKIYNGMVVGENSRPEDLSCNPVRKKNLTNHRSANKEIDGGLKAPRRMNLDQALEWISDDELVEVTPKSIRVRKTILDKEERQRAAKKRSASPVG